jgi:hypothetical protein
VAKVVEAQRAKPRGVTGADEPPPQRRRVEVPGHLAGEDRVGGRRGVAALPEARKRVCHFGNQRNRPRPAALGRRHSAVRERALDADRALDEVDVAPAQGDELAAAQPRKAGGEEQRSVLLGGGRAGERVDLLWRVEVKARRVVADADAVDVGDGVVRQVVGLARAP